MTSVQVAIGIKIIDNRMNPRQLARVLVLVFRKNQPNLPIIPILAPYFRNGILIPQFPPEVRLNCIQMQGKKNYLFQLRISI
jgi:hypothetical protein